MTNSLIKKYLTAIWLLSCIGILVFAYIQNDVHDMPIAVIWLLIFMTFPVGMLAAPLIGLLISNITPMLGISYHPFSEIIVYLIALVSLGYLQWFIIVPRAIYFVRNKYANT